MNAGLGVSLASLLSFLVAAWGAARLRVLASNGVSKSRLLDSHLILNL